jgi:hypothetical protein
MFKLAMADEQRGAEELRTLPNAARASLALMRRAYGLMRTVRVFYG